MPKNTTPKWAVVATWRRFALFATKTEAEEALAAWKLAREAEGMDVSGSKSVCYRATSDPSVLYDDMQRAQRGQVPIANQSAHVIKLAEHPICYIGVDTRAVLRLREMESVESTDFDLFAAAAKAKSEEWRQVEAL